MSDTPEFGLGAIESPDDPRDYQLADLFTALGIEPAEAAALPARYVHTPMPAVLNQHATPQCVAFSAAAEQAAYDIRDQRQWFDFDESRFFTMIGGGPGGADVRVAFNVRKATGYPTVGRNDAGAHKISAYYTVPTDVLAIKQAIFAFGPLVLATPWANSWFRPVNGVLPAPSGGTAGGHALVAYGWDDAKGLLLRNSWGATWGRNGDCWLPYAQLGTTWHWWRAIDVIEPSRWTLRIAPGADVQTAVLGTGCIKSWTHRTWGSRASSAPASKPVVRRGCITGAARTTTLVTAGVFAGRHVRLGAGVTLTVS